MQIYISSTDGIPIYLQIVNQVKYLVAGGILASGQELPPIRALAEKLLINPNTVARAYRELELAGMVEKRRTNGTFIAKSGPRLRRGECLKIITQRIDSLLAEARQMDFSFEEMLDLLRERDEMLAAGKAED